VSQDWGGLWARYAASAERNPAQGFRRALLARVLEAGPESRVLDIGSGQGDLALDLASRLPGIQLMGLDISETGLAEAVRKVPGARFLLADLTAPLDLPEGCAGWATHGVCTELLEHLENPAAALANVRPLLAPGARLVVTVPSGPMSAFDRHIGHQRHFRKQDLARVLEAAGFQVDFIWRAGFPFFNLYRLVVILRGERLIRDADAQATLPPAAQAAMAVFRFLFRFNAVAWGPGWQLVAVARNRP